MSSERDLIKARVAIRRGATPDEAIPACSCFQEGAKWKRCNSVCEDAAEWVAKAIAAERFEYDAIVSARQMKITDDMVERAVIAVAKLNLSRSGSPPLSDSEALKALRSVRDGEFHAEIIEDVRVAIEAALRPSDSE